MSDHPIRIQLRRTKGWKMPPNTVSVARGPGRSFGNPFSIGSVWRNERGNHFIEFTVCDPADAVARFKDMIGYCPRPYPTNDEIKAALRGKNLACWCPPDQPCHADVLLEIANG